MVQAGELNQPVSVLGLSQDGSVYSWAEIHHTWAKAEPQAGKNLFSSVGMGAKSIKFTVRKQELTLHNAFRWRGKFCFLTDITELDRLYYEVMAALIEPKACVLLKSEEKLDENLNREPEDPKPAMTFPACRVEKYLGFQQNRPQAVVNVQYVLVTPKEITLVTGDLVQTGGTTYSVQIVHKLDDYKNEYEIASVKEG